MAGENDELASQTLVSLKTPFGPKHVLFEAAFSQKHKYENALANSVVIKTLLSNCWTGAMSIRMTKDGIDNNPALH